MRKAIAVVVAAAFAVGLVAAPTPAAPEQLDASDPPETSGPLEAGGRSCKRQKEKVAGKTVAQGKACIRVYRFAPDAEADDERNYGVVWLQANLNARRGWCGLKAFSDMLLPSGIGIDGRTPKRRTEIGKRKRMTTELAVDAGGNTTTEASVSQKAIVFPKVIRARFKDDKTIFRLNWSGSSRQKLGFVSGVAISWPQDEAPEGISFTLNYEIRQQRRC